MSKIKVSVCISAYNHESFIEEALNSVLGQECDFDYEIIVSNDKSTDQTHEVITKIIDEHPEGKKICYFNQEENLGINGNLIFTLEQANGKYIALLEGDDFWIDNKKLQKQFYFLEHNPDYTICTGGYETIIEDCLLTRKYDEDVAGITYNFNNLAEVRPHYLNMFFKLESLEITRLQTFKYSGDNVIFSMCLCKGKGYFFNEIFGFRRIHINSAWTARSEIERIKMGFEQLYGLYQYHEFKKIVRVPLFYTYLDLVGHDNKSVKYILHSSKFIRKPSEAIYFAKVVFSFLINKNKGLSDNN